MFRILFLCVENAGRSQMAEGFAKRLAPPGVEVYSAGLKPVKDLHPVVAEAMKERGILLDQQAPKGLEALPKGAFDLVVGMGCGDACPTARAKRTIQWEIPNPKNQPMETVRHIRDQIETQVWALMSELK